MRVSEEESGVLQCVAGREVAGKQGTCIGSAGSVF